MLEGQKLSRNLNKIKKLWAEQGASIVFRKVVYLAGKKIAKSAEKRTLLKRDLLFENSNRDTLTNDIERVFSSGLLRSLVEIRSDVRLLPDEFAESILDEARRLLNDQFTIYGSLKVGYDSNRFSWSRDPLTDFVWPQKFTRHYVRSQKPYGTDVKTIWEIARFQFLSSLAYAYILTGEERYARFALDKVNSWIDENPFQHGIHWMMPMESSIRLINWCVYLPLMDIFKYADLSFKDKITQSIFEHLIYIRENLEVSPSQAGNHYLADLIGLLLSRLLFPSLEWAFESSEYANNEFQREVQTQFKKSGINFEGSLPYHRLSSEMCVIGIAFMNKNGWAFQPGIIEHFRQIAAFTRTYTGICDECPILGDNDSGIILKFFPGQERNRHGYLSFLFDSLTEDKSDPSDFEEFLCSIHFKQSQLPESSGVQRQNEAGCGHLQVREFDGLIISKHQSEAISFNSLHCSQGHTHNDKLSIYPVIGRHPLFIDRGSFSYTGFGDKRHEDRMTSSHNGPGINGWEQNTIWKDDLYYMNGEARCASSVVNEDNILTITGWHNGYRRYRKNLDTFRKIKWDTKERTMLITDWIEGNVSRESFHFTWHFLINPSWVGVMKDGCLVLTFQNQTVYFEDLSGIGFTLGQGFYCPGYQVENPCMALAASSMSKVGEKIRFLLRY